jgi:hypothetical protein
MLASPRAQLSNVALAGGELSIDGPDASGCLPQLGTLCVPAGRQVILDKPICSSPFLRSDVSGGSFGRHGVASLDDRPGVNLIMASAMPPLGIDIQNLALAFKDGGMACITDTNQDATAFQAADARSQHFLRWAKHVA